MRASLTLTVIAALLAIFFRPLFHAPAVRAGTALRLDIPELVQGSALILEGRVQSAEAVETEGGLVETIYQVAVDETYLGGDQPLRSVRLPGGVLPDGRGMLLSGMPRPTVGEDALLFLSSAGDRGVRVPVGLAQGRFRIVTRLDGAKVAVRDQGDLGLVDPISGAVVSSGSSYLRDYAELKAEVVAAVAQKRAEAGE